VTVKRKLIYNYYLLRIYPKIIKQKYDLNQENKFTHFL